jgi:hypothetical protein
MSTPIATAPRNRGKQREFSEIADGRYRLGVLDLGVYFDVERLRREHHELIGELSVGCDVAGAHTVDGMLSVADWNLSSARARTDRAKLLETRSNAPDIDWASLLEEVAQRVIAAERQGAPSQPLHTYERSGPEAVYDIDGWALLREHQTILFGDGGSLKSLLALYAGGLLARQGVHVLYADWELSGADHRERLERLFGTDMPLVHYLRCDRPLTLEADRIAREVRRLSIDYLVCDSIAFATGGPPEAAEHAMAYARAIRQIGIGSLHLAHINKSEHSDQKPFGSSFWHNSARLTWFVKQASAEGDRYTIGLFNRKSNLTRQYPAIGFDVDFTSERVSVERVNVADVGELADKLPLWQRMKASVQREPKVPVALANELGAKLDSVERTARRMSGLFTRVSGSDGIPRIALVTGRGAA